MRNVESTRSRRTQTLISSEVGYTHRASDILTDRKTSLGIASLHTLKRGFLECSKQIHNQSIYRDLHNVRDNNRD